MIIRARAEIATATAPCLTARRNLAAALIRHAESEHRDETAWLLRRKATLTSVAAKAGAGIRFNEYIEADGPLSKRKDSPYRSGRSPDSLKSKNPACAAVKREEEEDWG